jgi:hypothetical protein
MKTYTFELRDIGVHFHCKKGDEPKVGSFGIIRVGKAEVGVSLRYIQRLKDASMFGLWFFPAKGCGSPLVEHRGQKATITYGDDVTLTPEQQGRKPKAAKAERPVAKPKTQPVTPVVVKLPTPPKGKGLKGASKRAGSRRKSA